MKKLLLLLALLPLVGCTLTEKFLETKTAAPWQFYTKEELRDECNRIAPCPDSPTPAPEPPAPGPPPPVNPPAPADAGAGADEVDPAVVTWLDPSPAGLPVTAQLDSASISRDHKWLRWAGSRPEWYGEKSYKPVPLGSPDAVDADVWVLVQIKGRWYGATIGSQWRRMRTAGEVRLEWDKTGPSTPPLVQTKKKPVASYRPASGEVVGVLVSSLRRGYARPAPLGRSPIKLTVWP